MPPLQNMTFEGDRAIADLNLTKSELELASKRAQGDALRAMQSLARKELGGASGLKARSVNRRVKRFVRRGRLWIGAGRPYPLLTSFRDVRIAPAPRRGRGGPGVVIEGERQPGIFVRRINGVPVPLRQARLPRINAPMLRAGIRREDVPHRAVRSAEAVRRPYGPEAEAAFKRVIDATPRIIDKHFRASAERVIRARS